MRRFRRLAVLTTATVCGMVASGQAFAALTPRLSVTSSSDGATSITYAQGTSDDPLASLLTLIPINYLNGAGGDAEGATLGPASVTVVAADLGGSPSTYTGSVVAGLATTQVKVGGATQTLGSLSLACTGTAAPLAFWVLNVSGSGRSLQLPLFVYQLAATDPRLSYTVYAIKACLPPPDVPAGTPGRAESGTRITGLSFTVQDIFSTAAGWWIWRTLATPYAPGTGKEAPAAAREAQSQDRTPPELRLAVKGTTVAGRLLQGGKGVGKAKVEIRSGKKVVATATTNGSGRYSAAVPGAAGKSLVARAIVADRDISCREALFAPAPCTGATIGGFTVSSEPVKGA